MPDDDRQQKLGKEVSSVPPEKLQVARIEVELERQRLSPRPPPPKEEIVPADPEEEMDARMKQLDLIQDMQLILVDKYRNGMRLMFAIGGLMVVCSAGLVGLIVKNYDVTGRILALQSEQQKLLERGAQIEKKTDETKAKVDETNAKVDETNAKVDQAVESAPKIEVDDAGKARVVLSVKTSQPFAKKHAPPVPSASVSATAVVSAPPPSATAPLKPLPSIPVPSQLPVEQRKF